MFEKQQNETPFPPNNKNHKIKKTRKAEHFEVFHAHTERLKNNPIIYM